MIFFVNKPPPLPLVLRVKFCALERCRMDVANGSGKVKGRKGWEWMGRVGDGKYSEVDLETVYGIANV